MQSFAFISFLSFIPSSNSSHVRQVKSKNLFTPFNSNAETKNLFSSGLFNERALGSKWLDLSDYSDWDEIVEELKKEGFELDGIDEELFIQDVEGIEDRSVNWDYVNPETLFNTLKESGVLDNDYKYKVFCAFLEVRCYDDFEEKVKSHGDRWDDDINIYDGFTWEDFGREMFAVNGYDSSVPESVQDFIDFEAYGKYLGDYTVQEYSNGLIEIY